MAVSLDHLVLTVADIDATCRFYHSILGMERREFAGGRTSLHFGTQKINLHLSSAPISPHADQPMPGSADLCFLTDEPVGEALVRLEGLGITVIEGPVGRTGATGPINSIYLRDPDGNLVEISNTDT